MGGALQLDGSADLSRLHRMPKTYATVAPGEVSPRRAVPATIERPEYVDRPAPKRERGRRRQGRRDHREDADRRPDRRPGHGGRGRRSSPRGSPPTRSTGSATSSSCDHGAYPSTLGYKGFPKSLCTSVNEVICHGIPDGRRLEDGDIVNIDITAFIDGVHGDTDATYLCGDVDEESRLLVERTHEAMMRGDQGRGPGPARSTSSAGSSRVYAKRFGYGVVRDFTGHGIGTSFHGGLVIPHYDAAPSYDTSSSPA